MLVVISACNPPVLVVPAVMIVVPIALARLHHAARAKRKKTHQEAAFDQCAFQDASSTCHNEYSFTLGWQQISAQPPRLKSDNLDKWCRSSSDRAEEEDEGYLE
jgi:hypothetical protein